MKKLFVAVMALAAFAACQKDVVLVNDNETKTITLTISNQSEDSRGLGGDTNKGVTGACAEASDLVVLFAKADGTILFNDKLTSTGTTDNTHKGEGTSYIKDEKSGSYMWHMVPADVKQIAVVRFETGDITIENGTTNISAVEALAKNEAKNLDRELEDIVLYGVGQLKDTGNTHRVGTTLYHVWETKVVVAPALARFEIHKIQCTNLGAANADADLATYGLDELLINSLSWKGATETHTAVGFPHTLYGSYNNESATNNTQKDAAQRSNEYTPTKGAWSWNVLPCTFGGLTLDMTAATYDYTITDGNYSFPLTVVGLSKKVDGVDTVDNAFVAGNIYVINLIFNEQNISAQDAICVDVTVEIKPWTVVDRTPIYQ